MAEESVSLPERFLEIKTEADAAAYLEEKVEAVEYTRRQIDQMLVLGDKTPAELLRRAYTELRVRYGVALGSLVTLMHVRKLSDAAYSQMRERIDASVLPRVVGSV